MQYALNVMGIEGLSTIFTQIKLYIKALHEPETKLELDLNVERGEPESQLHTSTNLLDDSLFDIHDTSSDETALFLTKETQRIERSLSPSPVIPFLPLK